MTTLDRFLSACSAEITKRSMPPGPTQAVVQEGARAFEEALASAATIDRDPSSVPVAATLARAEPTALVDLARAAGQEIPWIPSHRMTDGGTEAALAPLNEVREFGDVVCGLLLLAPGCSYPEHSHPPQEIYLPIAGGGQWRYGGASDYRAPDPAGLIYNRPNDVHGIVAEDTPLLAIYVLWP